jgi:hypothetical protein
MGNLTDKQMTHISQIYNVIGDNVMLNALDTSRPLERFEMDILRDSTDPETGEVEQHEVERSIAWFGRLSLALDRWRREKDHKFEKEEEVMCFRGLLILITGGTLGEGCEDTEKLFKEYLEHPVGE